MKLEYKLFTLIEGKLIEIGTYLTERDAFDTLEMYLTEYEQTTPKQFTILKFYSKI